MKAFLFVLLFASLNVSTLAEAGDLADFDQFTFDRTADPATRQPIKPGSTEPNHSGSAQEVAGQSNPPVERSSNELREAALSRPSPIYPPLAKAARVSGSVEVEISIDPHGNVKNARAISGHPLLKDSSVAAALAWKFDPTKLSQPPITVVARLTFDFDLDEEIGKGKGLQLHSGGTETWEANVRIYRKEIGSQNSNDKKLLMALTRISVDALAGGRIDEALVLFEDANRQHRLPGEAKPYYGNLLVQKYVRHQRLAAEVDADSSSFEGALSTALQLFFEAYDDELGKDPPDSRKLADIARCIAEVYRSLEREEEACDSLKKILSLGYLADTMRAEVSYELGVAYWERAYRLASPYVIKNHAIPETYHAEIRAIADEGHFYIRETQRLNPTFANAWFYAKLLLAIIDLKLEPDIEKKKLIQREAIEAQDHFLKLRKQQEDTDTVSFEEKRPYTSGLPRLSVTPLPPLPPPPPPPRPRR